MVTQVPTRVTVDQVSILALILRLKPTVRLENYYWERIEEEYKKSYKNLRARQRQ